MDITIFLSKAFGIYFIVIGIVLSVRGKDFLPAVSQYIKNDGLMLLGATFTLILGIILILFHSIWVVELALLITICCWLIFIKGIMLLMYPQYLIKMSNKLLGDTYLKISSFFMILFGLFFGYMAWKL